jgi:hypothetical protein
VQELCLIRFYSYSDITREEQSGRVCPEFEPVSRTEVMLCYDPEKLMKVSELAGNRYKGIKQNSKPPKRSKITGSFGGIFFYYSTEKNLHDASSWITEIIRIIFNSTFFHSINFYPFSFAFNIISEMLQFLVDSTIQELT